MSALATISGELSSDDARARVSTALQALRSSGGEVHRLVHAEGGPQTVVFGAGAHAWELERRPHVLGARGPFTVVGDAMLFHREDLARALDAMAVPRPTDADLILLAFERWGDAAFARLEGEFAVVLHDRTTGRLTAARDFAGMRPLYFAEADGVFRIATRAEALLADPTCPRRLDLGSLAATAAGLWHHGDHTVFADIRELRAGHTLTKDPSGVVQIRPFWHPPDRVETRRQPLGPAADELRALLVDAVRERLDPVGPTAISLSGGWDSTAVGGAATVALGARTSEHLRPVSMSYPVGDPGREDELIETVAEAWGVRPHWIAAHDVPLLGASPRDPHADAAARALPFAHVYEHWNRALSRGARERECRVILDGVGGDQLFQVSDIFMSDLFARGQWVELAAQWRARGGSGLRNFWEWAVRPALPESLTDRIASARGMAVPPHYLLRLPPMWFRARFLAEHGVMTRELAERPTLPRHDRVLAETHAYLRFTFFTRVVALLRGYALDEGVALRSPLLDERVVRFAAQRPWNERVDRRETKILLRRAMRGLVPESVLAPRPHRTGVTSAYFLRQLRGPARALLESLLVDPLLAAIGMVEPVRLRRAWEHVMAHDDDETAARVFFTLQSELWLRARSDLLPKPPVAPESGR